MPAEQTVSITAKEGLTVGDVKDFLSAQPASAALHATLTTGGKLRKLEVRKTPAQPNPTNPVGAMGAADTKP